MELTYSEGEECTQKSNGAAKRFSGTFSMTYLLALTIMKIYKDHRFTERLLVSLVLTRSAPSGNNLAQVLNVKLTWDLDKL